MSNDAPFESDIIRTLPDIPVGERPKPRPTPKKARRAKLTEEQIAALEPEAKQFYTWDTKNTGLGVRVGSSGSRAFVLKMSLPGKRSVWKTLEASTLDAAVVEYHKVLMKFGREDATPAAQGETPWQDVVDKFQEEYLRTKLKETTKASYRSALKILRAAFMDRPIKSLTYLDLWDWHVSQAGRKRQANVCIMLCKVIFSRCRSVWGFLPREALNPVEQLHEAGWKPYPEETRDVRLSDDQIQAIGTALTKMETTLSKDGKPEESAYPIAAVRLLFFTGRRLREILDLRWDQVDLPGRILKIEHHKTEGKVGTLKTPLNDAALEVLQGLPRMTYTNKDGEEVENPYVMPGDEPGKSIQDIRKFWKRLTKLAGLEHVKKEESGELTTLRRHDLRHAHGNASADLGMTLQTTAALLGHKDAHTSARYSKTGQNPALAASQKVSGSLKAKMGGDR